MLIVTSLLIGAAGYLFMWLLGAQMSLLAFVGAALVGGLVGVVDCVYMIGKSDDAAVREEFRHKTSI